jgi:hypothetical protein
LTAAKKGRTMRDSTKTKKTVPTYRLHKTSGRAIVTLPAFGGKRRDIFLGRYGTDESRQRYAQVIAEWTAMGDVRPHPTSDITIVELVDRYWAHDLARRGLLDQGSIVVLPLVNQGVTGYLSWRDCPTTGTRVPIVVLHDEAIARRSGLFVKREKLYEWTLTHEIGHALGVPAANSHTWVVPGLGGNHCTHPECVMYTGFDWRVLWTGIVRGWPIDFCRQCTEELRQARERAEPKR